MIRIIKKSKTGLTLVELLVAMGLFSIIVALISGLYLFTNKNIITWKEKAFLNSQILLVCESLRNSLNGLTEINTAEPTRLIFRRRDYRTIEIEYADDQVLRRNGANIISKDCRISSFKFEFLSVINGGHESVIKRDDDFDKNHNFHLENGELGLINAIEFEFTAGYRNHSKKIRQLVTLRDYLNK